MDNQFWSAQRKRIAHRDDIINLNAGTLSPTPLEVLDRCNELRRMQAENPSDFFWRQTERLIDDARSALSDYLHCNPRDLLLLPNVTNALNIAIGSLDLPEKSEILTTQHEYGAILNVWKVHAANKGWTIRTFEIPDQSNDPADYVRALEKAIGPTTRVLFFSHVAFTTGLLLPAKALCEAARASGITTVVDGAHAPGGTNVDLGDINADFYGANLHKWFMAPAGAGFLCARQEYHQTMKPVVVSWGYPYDFAKAYEPSGTGGSRFHWSFEYQGVLDRTPQMVAPEVIAFRKSLGGENAIYDRVRGLGNYALDTIGKILKPSIPRDSAFRGPIVSFEFPKCDPVAARNRFYEQFHIECPVSLVGERFFLRVSTAWFNTHEEINRLGEALRRIG